VLGGTLAWLGLATGGIAWSGDALLGARDLAPAVPGLLIVAGLALRACSGVSFRRGRVEPARS
jgi:hypothetical protein